jgi:hypothetical protein
MHPGCNAPAAAPVDAWCFWRLLSVAGQPVIACWPAPVGTFIGATAGSVNAVCRAPAAHNPVRTFARWVFPGEITISKPTFVPS